MVFLQSIPAMICFFCAAGLAALFRLGKAGQWAAVICVLLVSLLILLVLLNGGGMHEALACLLLLLWLLMPGEARHEL